MRFLVVLSVFLAACDSTSDATDPDGGIGSDGAAADGVGTDAPAAGFAIDATTAVVRLRAGSTVTLTVMITGNVAETTVSVTGLPPGVTIAPKTVNAAGPVELDVVAATGAVPSLPVTATIAAVAVADPARRAEDTVEVRVNGEPGALDATLAGDGSLMIDFSADGLQREIAFEPDYDFFLVSNSADKVVRYRAAGTIDTTFVHEGFAEVSGTKLIPIDATRLAIARGYLGGRDLALHDGSGQRVPSFGGTGLITPPYNLGDTKHANGVLYTSGGGGTTRGRFQSISLTGAITTITTSDLFATDSVTDFAVDPSSRILMGGERGTAAVIGRITAAGTADTTFGAGGAFEVASPFAQTPFVFTYVALAASGGGYALINFNSGSTVIGSRVVLVSFSAQGVPGTPVVITATDPDSYAAQIAVQPDGKVLVAGSDAGAGFVRRYLTNGTLDASFATNGSLALPRVPDQLDVFADDRIVLTSFDMTFNAWALHVTRVFR